MLTDKAKLNDVQHLLASLKDDLTSSNLTQKQRREALEQLKVYGRDPKDAAPIFSEEGIEILAKHGLTEKSSPSSLEALRCLANALLLVPETRQILVDLGCAGSAAERLKVQDSDNEFLISRILFLMTYDTKLNFDPLFDDHDLGGSISSHIARHTKQFSQADNKLKSELSSVDQAALSESLKLQFNLTTYYPQHIPTFDPCIDNTLHILNHIAIPDPPLQPPITYVINALVNLNLQDDHQSDSTCSLHTTTTILVTILSLSLRIYKPSSLEVDAIPILTLLRKIYATTSSPAQKQYMQSLLLPQQSDRDLPLGQTDTLPSMLLRLSTSPAATNLRESISGLLFELSGQDATTFVRNVGYGYAAGFLLSHGIAVPESTMKAQRYAGQGGEVAGEEEADEELVNPITGQKLSKERAATVDTGPEMSEEEKEREAEKLFVLFERLKATGVVSVENPVREAVEKGRIDGGTGGGRVDEVDDDGAG